MSYAAYTVRTVDEMLENASQDDLEKVKRALIREATIRDAMAETGEDRQTVTDMMAAMESMGQEAVLNLTEGEPTTLAEALQRYVDTHCRLMPERIAEDLSALLAYPWPGVPHAEALTWEIHKAYVRLAPKFGVEVTPWDELEDYQRDLALSVVNDLMAHGVVVKRAS